MIYILNFGVLIHISQERHLEDLNKDLRLKVLHYDIDNQQFQHNMNHISANACLSIPIFSFSFSIH